MGGGPKVNLHSVLIARPQGFLMHLGSLDMPVARLDFPSSAGVKARKFNVMF
jgi:hypothetical protein